MLTKTANLLPAAMLLAVLAAACSPAEPVQPASEATASVSPTAILGVDASPSAAPSTPAPTAGPAATNVRVQDPNEYQFSPLLPFDGIPPVYKPQFAGAAEAPLRDDELVIGVAIGGEAKAYPITVLRFREMVNDELGGIPTLVTW